MTPRFQRARLSAIGTSLASNVIVGSLEKGLSDANQSRMVQGSGRQHPGSRPPMNDAARRVQTTYLVLLLLHTLAASFIWGINTLFLLDAGLSNTRAFATNAFFTAGMVIFEVPTGVLADTRGRRTSYLLGTITLAFATLLYLLLWRVKAPLARPGLWCRRCSGSASRSFQEPSRPGSWMP